MYIGEAEEFADDRRIAANTELPYLLFGSVIVYLIGTLEATLGECLATALAVLQRPPKKSVANPKLENFFKMLGDCGIYIEWDVSLWDNLRAWRRVRNAIVHELEMPQSARFGGIEAAVDSAWDVYNLVESAIVKVDQAMLALKPSARPEPTS